MSTFTDTFSDGALDTWTSINGNWVDTGVRLEKSGGADAATHTQDYAYGTWTWTAYRPNYYGAGDFFISDGTGTATSRPDNGYGIIWGNGSNSNTRVQAVFVVRDAGAQTELAVLFDNHTKDSFDVAITRDASDTFTVEITDDGGTTYSKTVTDSTITASTEFYARGYNETHWRDTVAVEPPLGLSVTPGADGELDLSWADVSASGYTIYRSQSSHAPSDGTVHSTTNYTQIDSVGGSTTSYTDTGLSESTTYYYRVESTGSFNSTDYLSREASAETILPSPVLNSVSTVSDTSLDLSVSNTADTATELRVYRATSPGSTLSDYTQVATVDETTTQYTGSGLLNGTTYYYVVTAYDGSDESSPSTEASATTLLPAPTGLSVSTITSTGADLEWTDNSNSETAYRGFVRRTEGPTGMSFDAANPDYIAGEKLGRSGNVSMSVTVIYGNLAADAATDTFFAVGQESTDNTFGFRTSGDSGYVLFFWGDDLHVSSENLTGGVHTATARYDAGAQTQSILHDGTELGSRTTSGTFNLVDTAYRVGTRVIGAEPLDGEIYAVHVHGHSLSLSEHDTIRNGGLVANGLYCYLPLDLVDSPSTGLTPDVSEYANHGTVNGPTLTGPLLQDKTGALAADTTSATVTGLLNGEEYDAILHAETTDSVVRDQ